MWINGTLGVPKFLDLWSIDFDRDVKKIQWRKIISQMLE